MRNRSQSENSRITMLKLVIISSAVGLICLLALLLLFAILMTFVDFPSALVGFISAVLLCISALISGIFAGKLRRIKGIATGIVCGLFLFAVCFIIGLFFGNGITAAFVPKLIMTVTAAAIGGVIGVNMRSRG